MVVKSTWEGKLFLSDPFPMSEIILMPCKLFFSGDWMSVNNIFAPGWTLSLELDYSLYLYLMAFAVARMQVLAKIVAYAVALYFTLETRSFVWHTAH
jgi:peptidoglycan/LPS O-acetylase OafA/YrhL